MISRTIGLWVRGGTPEPSTTEDYRPGPLNTNIASARALRYCSASDIGALPS